MNNQIINNKEFRIDETVAYFIGVLHSDGCIYIFNDKKYNRKVIRLSLNVGEKSIPMAMKFKEILSDYFDRTVNLRKVPNKNSFVIQTSINRLYNVFKKWENNQLPNEIKKDAKLFGPYLAGLIDGDGHLKLKNNKDRRLKQLIIRICGPKKLADVKKIIERYTSSKVHFVNYKNKNCFDTCFYVTYKNLLFLENHVFPNIVMPYKKQRFEEHAKKIRWACRDSKFSAARDFLRPP